MASGLNAALHDLGLSKPHVVGIGNVEIDRSFLVECGLSDAVTKALSSFREACDITLRSDHGCGVIELIGLASQRRFRTDASIAPWNFLGSRRPCKPCPAIETLWMTSGRLYWIVTDEGHYYLLASCNPTGEIVCRAHAGLVLATATPD